MNRRLVASRSELEARDEREQVAGLDLSPIAEAVPRDRVRVGGTVVALTYPPKDAHPELSCRIHDGTGAISLVFVGRRDVPGISAGRRIIAEGVVAERNGQCVIYSPSYELLPGMGE